MAAEDVDAVTQTLAASPDPRRLTVDVVVNNHDYGRFLADAVESALAQTHANVTVIVVDDGSTDESREILQAYEGKTELVLKPNGGQASALNAGFARCKSDIVIFLDADDVLRPDAAALVASAFAADKKAAKVQFRMEIIDDNGSPTGVVKPPHHLPLPQGDVQLAELVFPFDLVWLPTSGNAFSADALRRILPIPEREFAHCPDWYLVHLTPLLGHVVSLEEIGACYRVHGANRYELLKPTLDLDHVRLAVEYSAATTGALERLRDELGLARPYTQILSVADLANRLVSLKLEPESHPIQNESVWRLAREGMRAATRRFDVSWAMKLLFIGWFGIMAATPRPLVRPLAESFLFAERREHLNRLLRRLHRWNRKP